MPNIITAGNSTNGGTAISTDTSGTLNIVTGSGSGANAITIDASQAVTMPGNLTVSGTLSASGGVSGGIRSATTQASTSGTSIDFTSIPTGVKRITVMFSGVSTSGTSNLQIQIGPSGGVETSGYGSSMTYIVNATPATTNVSTGFLAGTYGSAGASYNGIITICTLGSSIWTMACNLNDAASTRTFFGSGGKTITGTLDRVRITTVNGTDTFDAGSINILYE